VVGFAVIYHLHQLSLKNIDELNTMAHGKKTRRVELPEGMTNPIKRTQVILDEIQY